MAEGDVEIGDDDRLENRRNCQNGNGKNGGKKLYGVLFALAVVAIAPFFLFGPSTIAKFVGLDASESEEIQRASKVDTGISTRLPNPPAPETALPDLTIPAREVVVPKPTLSDEEKQRIADLEAKLKALEEQPVTQSVTAEQIADLLKNQKEN